MEGGGEVDVDALTEQLELLRQLQEQGRELNERARSRSSNEEDWDDEEGDDDDDDDAREQQFTSGASRFSEPQQVPGGELTRQEQWALSPRRGSGLNKQLGAAGGGGSASENVRVVLRVRPPLAHELNGYLGVPYRTMTQVSSDGSAVTLCDPSQGDDRGAKHSFAFDHVYDQQATQQEVYDTIARPLVASCLEGYNATILAYGQTGTGKTYTMEGEAARFEDRGIMPRAIEQIFGHIQEKAVGNKRFLVRASYLQIYNDLIYDLLKPESYNLQIREDDKTRHDSRGVYVDGLSEWVVRSPQEVFKLIAAGRSLRATGKTKLNELSSRSHAILRLIVEQVETSFGQAPSVKGNPGKQRFRVAKLNLVDLAGSERVRISGATGQRLEESRKINRSLSALGNVISALTDQQGRTHIPYRDSKLTRILEDSLGGNCRTAMIAMVSPAYDATSETLSTLKFANRAKNIRNKAFVNEDVDKNSLLRKYERELKRLRKELRHKSQSVVDQRVVLELEDQKRRAEADKMAALRALESRSFEFMQEKQAKRKLEEKISQLESQMLIGGHLNGKKLQDTPQFRTALDAHRNQIRKEYKEKLDDLEKEREQIGAQRAQVDRYKQLLLKQRDIMVALTQRLNERDEQIETLQDELEEVNRDHFKKQEQLDRKTTEVIHLQRINCELEQQQKQLEQTDELTKEKKEAQQVEIEVPSANGSEQLPEPSPGPSPGQIGLEARVRALTCQYQSFRDEMTSRLGKKDSQVRQLLEENAALRLQDNRELQKEVEQHRQRSVNHAKEITAMGTIMEKIHVLTLNVLSHSDTVDPEVKPQLQALSSLVSASVAALRNSKSTFGNNPTDPVTKG